ncbi:MAG: hypothetical protein ABIN97_02645 [Ginsengibacter sp.]
MKMILGLTIAILLTCSYAICQPVIGMGAGYTTAKSPVINLQFGFKAGNNLIYYTQLIHTTRNINAPQLLGLRYGYNICDFQLSAGLDYHLFGREYKAGKHEEGFHYGFGITKYFKSFPLKVDAGMSGKYIIANIGFYKVLEN